MGPTRLVVGAVARQGAEASISVSLIPPPGAGEDTWGQIGGEATGVDLAQTRACVYALGGNTYYVQPFADRPLTTITDGKWKTGTHLGAKYAALLVKAGYAPPATLTTLPEVGGDVLAVTVVDAKVPPPVGDPLPRKITFSGLEWDVKAGAKPMGPGPCLFSNSEDNVFVDNRGRLHLKIIQREDGAWTTSEIVSLRSFGFGTYRFYLDTPVNDLDPNVILGLFTWSDRDEYAHREIDIEVARWSKPDDKTNAQFTVQPYGGENRLVRFTIPAAVPASLHSFTWAKDKIAWSCRKGHDPTDTDPANLIKEWAFTGANIPQPGDEKARLNLWLNEGQAPARGQAVEIIVRKFEFIPPPKGG